MNFLLEVGKSDYGDKIIETLGPTETLLFGGRMLLLGMLTVFSVLIIIWIALALFKVFFHDIPSKRRTTAATTPATEIAPVAPSTATADEEIIAVIAAAIATAEAEAGGAKFRVVSFRRK